MFGTVNWGSDRHIDTMAFSFLFSLFFILYVSLVSGDQSEPCSFPSMLHMEDGAALNRWRFLSPDTTFNRTHKTGQWHVHQHSAYVSHGQSETDYDSADGYDLECVKAIGDDKVLVKRLDMTTVPKYTCIQFVKRSAAVVQFSIAEYSTTLDDSLCDEKDLKRSDAPLVRFDMENWGSLMSQIPYMTCGLDGGYVIRQWHDEKKSPPGCIDDLTNSLRVEDECDKGSGFQIFGESQTCPSPLTASDSGIQKEPMYCIARWEDDNYAYSVGTDEWGRFFLCMRKPKGHGNQFKLDLFLDGVCDSTADMTVSKNYRTLDLTRHVVTDVCGDTTPFCELLAASQCTGRVAQNCRHSCATCPKDQPWKAFETPDFLRGEWLRKTSSLAAGKITVTNNVIQSSDMGNWRYFGKSPCNRTRYGLQKSATEHLILSTSGSGCLPRAATLMVNKFSPAVVGLQISKSKIAEFPLKNGTNKWNHDLSQWCRDTRYVEDEDQLRDKYHTGTFGWYSVLNLDTAQPGVECDMSDRGRFSMKLPSGQNCQGALKQRSRKSSFEFVLESCDGSNTSIPDGLDRPIRHDCLAMFDDDYGWKTYVITRTPSNVNNIVNETYACWWLRNDVPRGHIVRVGDCLLKGTPLANLYFDKVPGSDTSDASRVPLTLSSMMFALILCALSQFGRFNKL